MIGSDFWERRGSLVAAVLGGAAVVLVAAVVWVALLAAPPFSGPTPSPTAVAPGSPSPEISPTSSPTIQPTLSPEPTTSPAPSPSLRPSPSPQLTPTAVPRPTTPPPISPSPAPPSGWMEVIDFPTYRGSTSVESITAGGPGFVAVGSGGRQLQGRVWTSSDGLSWESARDSNLDGYALRKVVRAGDTLFAFGRDRSGTSVWHSVDGGSWQFLTDEAGASLRGIGINDVAVVNGTLIAVGLTDAGQEAGIWRSEDGAEWERVNTPTGMDEPWAVAVRGTTIVLIGRYPHLSGPLIAHSTDLGDSWQPAEVDVSFGHDNGGGLVSVAANGERFVAVGYAETEFDQQPIAMWSPDGRRWSSVALDIPRVQLFEQLAPVADGFVALGTEHAYLIGECRPVACISDEQVGLAFFSRDGSSWRALPNIYEDTIEVDVGDELVTERAIVASRRGVVVVQRWGESVRVWFAPIEVSR